MQTEYASLGNCVQRAYDDREFPSIAKSERPIVRMSLSFNQSIGL